MYLAELELPERAHDALKNLFEDLKTLGIVIKLRKNAVNIRLIDDTIEFYDELIDEIADWPFLRFLVLTDLNGVLGFRKNKGKGLNRRPNINLFLTELDKLNEDGVYTLVYTSARQKNIQSVLEDSAFDLSYYFFDQTFCFIRTLNTAYIDPIDDDDIDIDGIKRKLNDFLYTQHVNMQLGILESNIDMVVASIYAINIVLQLFMFKGSKDLKNIESFVKACRCLNDEKDFEEPLTIVLIDDEVQKKLPTEQQNNGYQIESYDEVSSKTFDINEDNRKIRKIMRDIRHRINENK